MDDWLITSLVGVAFLVFAFGVAIYRGYRESTDSHYLPPHKVRMTAEMRGRQGHRAIRDTNHNGYPRDRPYGRCEGFTKRNSRCQLRATRWIESSTGEMRAVCGHHAKESATL